MPTNRKWRMGMVGGGPGAFIGPVHKMAAELDGRIELVAGAFSQSPEKSRQAGEAWRDRLLRLPPFLRQETGHGESGVNGWSDQDLQDGFALTGLFLLRHVLEPRGQGHSDARDGFINAVMRHRARAGSI